MVILTIETCTDMSMVGIVRDGVILGEVTFPGRHTLVQRILLRLEWLLKECSLTKTEIDTVAVSKGPGSFTGVRIGLAVAKIIAWGLQIPVIGISTLEAIAYPFRQIKNAILIPVINARRQQLYSACFSVDNGFLQRLLPDSVLSPADFSEIIREYSCENSKVLIIGQEDNIPAPFLEVIGKLLPIVYGIMSPVALAAIAQARIQESNYDDIYTIAPIYLRPAADR